MSTETLPANRFQEQFGVPSEGARTKVRDTMSDQVQDYIRNAPFVVLASSDAEGRCDASPKGGKPGFVRIIDERNLLLPDVAGNRLFQSYENIDANPRVGLLFMIPGDDKTVRVNGKASIVDAEELKRREMDISVHNPDDKARNQQGLLIEVEEAYGHCPRAYKFSKLWDVDQIRQNREG